jgi:hypothetical protein
MEDILATRYIEIIEAKMIAIDTNHSIYSAGGQQNSES